MARKALIEKHKRRQQTVAKHAAKRAELIALIKKEDTDYDARREAYRAIAKMPRDASRTRVRNRCELTGRSRGYYRKFGLSRIALRELAHQGQLPGVIKASW